MVMSDRIALLRAGELEQISTPKEIYRRPATAYTAQFIGHTNLLRGEVKDGVAHCQSLSWKTEATDGPALFSLRPEDIRIASGVPGKIGINGKVKGQVFHGATELLQVECCDGLQLTVRLSGKGGVPAEVALDFSPEDAVPVRESQQRI